MRSAFFSFPSVLHLIQDDRIRLFVLQFTPPRSRTLSPPVDKDTAQRVAFNLATNSQSFLRWTISERKLAARSLSPLKVGNEKLRRHLQIARWNGRGKAATALQRANIKSQVAEKKQKFSLTTNATSKRCYLSSLELKAEREAATGIVCLQAEKTLESGYAEGPLFRNGEILFSIEKKLVRGSSQGSCLRGSRRKCNCTWEYYA